MHSSLTWSLFKRVLANAGSMTALLAGCLISPVVAAQSQLENNAPKPFKVLVIPPRIEVADTAAPSFMDGVLEAFLQELRNDSRLEVIFVGAEEPDRLATSNASDYDNGRRARNPLTYHFGSSYLAELSIRPFLNNGDWSVRVMWEWSEGGVELFSAIHYADQSRPSNDTKSIGRNLVAWVDRSLNNRRVRSPPDESEINTLLNPSIPVEARLEVLDDIRGTGFSAEILNAAVELATLAISGENRREAWEILRRNVYEPTLIPSLTATLYSDPDDDVRLQAAAALKSYVHNPVAEQALQVAAVSDAAPEVRLAAQVAPMRAAEQLNLFETILLDDELPPDERAAPLLLHNLMGAWLAFPSDKLVQAAAELVLAANDTEIKVAAMKFISLAHSDRTGDLGAPKRRRANPDPLVVDAIIHILEFPGSINRFPAITLAQMTSDQRTRDAYEAFKRRVSAKPDDED